MYDAKLSSRSVIHDSAGSAGRTMGIADSPSDIEESKHTHGTDQRQGIYTYGEIVELRLPPDRRLLPYGPRQARDDPGVVERRGPRGALHTRRTARKTRTRRASRAAAAGALWPHRRRRGKRWSGQRRHVVASLRAVASLRGMLLAVRALPRVAGDALAARMRAPCIGSSLHVATYNSTQAGLAVARPTTAA